MNCNHNPFQCLVGWRCRVENVCFIDSKDTFSAGTKGRGRVCPFGAANEKSEIKLVILMNF